MMRIVDDNFILICDEGHRWEEWIFIFYLDRKLFETSIKDQSIRIIFILFFFRQLLSLFQLFVHLFAVAP